MYFVQNFHARNSGQVKNLAPETWNHMIVIFHNLYQPLSSISPYSQPQRQPILLDSSLLGSVFLGNDRDVLSITSFGVEYAAEVANTLSETSRSNVRVGHL